MSQWFYFFADRLKRDLILWFDGGSGTGEAIDMVLKPEQNRQIAAVVGRANSTSRTVSVWRASGTIPGIRSMGRTPVVARPTGARPAPVAVAVMIVFRWSSASSFAPNLMWAVPRLSRNRRSTCSFRSQRLVKRRDAAAGGDSVAHFDIDGIELRLHR